MLVLILLGPRLLGTSSGHGLLTLAGLDALGMVVAAHLLSIWRLYHERNRMLRERANIGVLAGLIAWLPLIVVAWLPPMTGLVGVAVAFPVSPYIGLLSLCVIAVAYPLLVTWSDVAKLESAIRVFAAGLVTGGALLGVLSFVVNVLDSTVHLPSDVRTAINIGFSLLALPVFAPLTRCVQTVVEHYLGVDGADYARGCATITNELVLAVAVPDLVAALTKFAPTCLQLDTIGMWMRGVDRAWRLYQDGTPSGQAQDPPARLLVDICDRPAAERSLPLTPAPGLLAGDESLCLPIFVRQDLRGLLVLGKRHVPAPYGAADLAALLGLADQVSCAVQRIDGITLRFGQATPAGQGTQLSIVGVGG
jgi:GAF domain-containing protein